MLEQADLEISRHPATLCRHISSVPPTVQLLENFSYSLSRVPTVVGRLRESSYGLSNSEGAVEWIDGPRSPHSSASDVRRMVYFQYDVSKHTLQ
ncbi:hypothetical protein CCHR01_01551 [Colletotrichum chrysophilum]|uniref:Uncharacterized protein n=1 Tax=Colletotrichum chrysophilum TaxID=1836956 RepID=A0AAD9AWE9_9PEZI|nr:hypothetical protein CCHR01_01551 [Colletotrichum chrysophilum]